MMEEDELIDERCKSELFIESLYNVLRKGTENNCFLEGAFVISDQDGGVLDALTNSCLNDNGNLANTYRSSLAGIITHDVFMNKTRFREIHAGSKLDIEYLKQQNILVPGFYYNTYNQYENDIRNENHKVKQVEFLCNPRCRQNPQLAECLESRRKTKRIILFYPFAVVKNAPLPENEEVRRYIYFKLEDSHAISASHAVSASMAYLAPSQADNSGFDYRRERITRSDEDRYKTRLRDKDERFYYRLYNIDRNNTDIRFYNDYVRSNDEFYIPQQMTNDILSQIQ